MSSVASRASRSPAAWQQHQQHQQQSAPQDGHKSHAPQNVPIQSQTADSRSRSNHTVTSYQAQDLQGDRYNPTSHTLYDQASQITDTQTETQHSSADFSSQYLSYGNYLTPDQGSEIPFSEQSSHTSPSIDDILWQENFSPSQSLEDFGNSNLLINNIFAGLDQTGDLQGISSKQTVPTTLEPRSLTPRMSTTTATTTVPSTLTGVAHSTGPTYFTSGRTMADAHKRSHASSEADEAQNDRLSRLSSGQPQSQSTDLPITHAVNPLVLVSTYNRGDSPARSVVPMARSLSKRSQSSRLSDHGETLTAADVDSAAATTASSRLRPPMQYDDQEWDDDQEEEPSRSGGGIAPTGRGDETIPSLKDMEKQRELDENRAEVENWLAHSESGSPNLAEGEQNPFRNRGRRERPRSRSTGARHRPQGPTVFTDEHIPGPGILIDESSVYHYDSDTESSRELQSQNADEVPESPPADIEAVHSNREEAYFSTVAPDQSVPPEEQEPLPRQFYNIHPWQDPFRVTESVNSRGQPPTSNQAMMQYDRQAAKFETASRAATWGTRRRLSDSEISAIVDGSKVRHLSLSQKTRERGNSFITKARELIPRRSSSNIKKQKDHNHRQQSPPTKIEPHSKFDHDPEPTTTSPMQPVQRTFSWGKSRSPPLTATSSALMTMTSHLSTIGSSTAATSVEPERPKSPFLGALKRSRSKSDIPKTPKRTPGLSELFNKHGGPPVPTLASPMQMRPSLDLPASNVHSASNVDDEVDEDGDEEMAIRMPLPVQTHNIIPNLDGFRTHVQQLNPRLEAYLVERIAQDQLRRYKKLVKNKIEHTRNVQQKQQCPSGIFCVELGGKPKILPPRTSAKDANVNYAQFKVGAGGESDGDESSFVEGVVTPALFPSGIPLPPAARLPAEFECPLCFQVKKFQKPSDWTKHVHEDVQPFSCTFPNCPEPKSFKRKADWVRHENERHRHLEWWRCSIHECAHICYRKDNFVQHLVREHKMTEPKSRGQRSVGSRVRATSRGGSNSGQDADDFWQLVEQCRHETTQSPRQEACKFCGNICSTWKKLSVHVGKHMEQIAMPVLELAGKRIITADTTISPIDPPNGRMAQPAMLDTAGLSGNNFDTLSPYAASAVSNYQSSSAGHSPVPASSTPNPGGNPSQMLYEAGMMPNGMQPVSGGMQQFAEQNTLSQNYPFSPYEVPNGQGYIGIPQGGNGYAAQPATQAVSPPYHASQVPRSQPMEVRYNDMNADAPMYNEEQYYGGSAANPYMGGYNTVMSHPDGISHSPHDRHTGQIQVPGTSAQVDHSGYMYAPHHNGNNGETRYY